jgi:hypothetical protein
VYCMVRWGEAHGRIGSSCRPLQTGRRSRQRNTCRCVYGKMGGGGGDMDATPLDSFYGRGAKEADRPPLLLCRRIYHSKPLFSSHPGDGRLFGSARPHAAPHDARVPASQGTQAPRARHRFRRRGALHQGFAQPTLQHAVWGQEYCIPWYYLAAMRSAGSHSNMPPGAHSGRCARRRTRASSSTTPPRAAPSYTGSAPLRRAISSK